MFRVIFCKRLIVLLGSIVMICVSSVSVAQDNDKPFVRLATYWDAPGRVKAISADDRWIVIYDLNDNISRLVEVGTGGVLATGQGENSIRFSPNGRFVVVGLRELKSTLIINLSTKQSVVQIPEMSVIFSPDDAVAMAIPFSSTIGALETQIIDLTSGTALLTTQGLGSSLSPDSRFIAMVDVINHGTKVIEISTGKTVFEISMQNYQAGQDPNITTYFSPDSSLLAIYQAHDFATYVIDTTTWQVLYNVLGWVRFSPDGHFLTVRGDDSAAAGVKVYEARTGKLVSRVYGNMGFSPDGSLLYRIDSTNCAYNGAVQVIELATMKTLLDIQDCVNVRLFEDNTVARVSRGDIDQSQTQQFIDVATGKLIWHVEAADAEMVDLQRHVVHLTKHYYETLEDFVTGQIFASEREITLAYDKKLAFASNGFFVDLYGSPETKVDTMPVPRIGGGIVQAPAGTLTVYTTQEMAHTIEETSRNPFVLSVMGKSADEQWLYVTYTVYQPEVRHKAVWILNQNLTVIEDWQAVPVLDASDPLASLREMSEYR